MKKKIFTFILALALVFIVTACNSNNSVGVSTDYTQWFTDTGIRVKNHQDRVYSIVEDENGWLYYCSDVEGNLTPVISEFGLPTKDITVFD